MSIPDEAINAAVEAHCEGTMRAALEAAAPYLMAAAWDEGETAGHLNHAADPDPELEPITNPYRSQA